MFRRISLVAWGLVVFVAAVAGRLTAQEGVLDELYGNGVHAYFAGDLATAQELFADAIDAGTTDPRAYYFQGLAHLRRGSTNEAIAYFERGARLEMSDTDRFYDVSQSLERVQGRPRLLLERYRTDARLKALKELQRRRYERYERIREAEPDVLLRPSDTEQSAPPADGALPQPAVPGAAAIDEETTAEEMPDDATEPPADEPAEDDPFGTSEPADEPADDEIEADADAGPTPKVPASVLGKALSGAFGRAFGRAIMKGSETDTGVSSGAPLPGGAAGGAAGLPVPGDDDLNAPPDPNSGDDDDPFGLNDAGAESDSENEAETDDNPFEN